MKTKQEKNIYTRKRVKNQRRRREKKKGSYKKRPRSFIREYLPVSGQKQRKKYTVRGAGPGRHYPGKTYGFHYRYPYKIEDNEQAYNRGEKKPDPAEHVFEHESGKTQGQKNLKKKQYTERKNKRPGAFQQKFQRQHMGGKIILLEII
jgi:hypothetical protein